MQHWETAVWEDWRPASWILWQHWAIRHMDAESVTAMECSNRRLRTDTRWRVPDNWLKDGNPFEVRREEYAKEVRFGGNIRFEKDPETGQDKFIQENYQSVLAIPYDMPIIGYGNHVVNTLTYLGCRGNHRLSVWTPLTSGDYHKAVEQENLAKTIVEVLYPNDNHYAGKELRLKQQYFFVSASLQALIAKYKEEQ